jgi:hypothetical protein
MKFMFSPQSKGPYKIRGCIQKFPDWVDNEINNNKHSLRSNTKDYGDKTQYTDSQDSDTTALSGRELYHLQFSLQAASSETFGYTLVNDKTCCVGYWLTTVSDILEGKRDDNSFRTE